MNLIMGNFHMMRVVIAAGERSGLVLADLLRQKLEVTDSQLELCIINVAFATGEIIGFLEPLINLVNGYGTIKRLTRIIKNIQPDVAVLISFPGINLLLGRALRSLGIPVVYIAPPQSWAWGKFRVKYLRQAADWVVCLFRFEQKILRAAGVNARYYGYPFLDMVNRQLAQNQVYRLLGLPEGMGYVVFLPGSRKFEIDFHEPLFIQVFYRLMQKYPQLPAVLIGGANIDLPPGMVRINPDYRYDVIAHAQAALVVSGTATAEIAILGVPMVVTYHLPPVNRFFARLFVKLPYFALPNIIANQLVVPEYLDGDVDQLSSALGQILDNVYYREAIKTKLWAVRRALEPAGATDRIVQLLLSIRKHPQ